MISNLGYQSGGIEMKNLLSVAGGIIVGMFLIMLYMHRRVIVAAIRGDEIPKAPESCPYSKKQ